MQELKFQLCWSGKAFPDRLLHVQIICCNSLEWEMRFCESLNRWQGEYSVTKPSFVFNFGSVCLAQVLNESKHPKVAVPAWLQTSQPGWAVLLGQGFYLERGNALFRALLYSQVCPPVLSGVLRALIQWVSAVQGEEFHGIPSHTANQIPDPNAHSL